MRIYTMPQELARIELVCRAVGLNLGHLYRTVYEYKGEIDSLNGEITLVFFPGQIFRFYGNESGVGVAIAFDRWTDPFGKAMDRDEAVANQHGHYVENCLDDHADWKETIGKPLVGVREIKYLPHSTTAGLSLDFGAGAPIYIYNISDELAVVRSLNPLEFATEKMCPRRE
jgi:hypothetical protein